MKDYIDKGYVSITEDSNGNKQCQVNNRNATKEAAEYFDKLAELFKRNYEE